MYRRKVTTKMDCRQSGSDVVTGMEIDQGSVQTHAQLKANIASDFIHLVF
jgi:hypothetical protein